jgi:hypothetical protein
MRARRLMVVLAVLAMAGSLLLGAGPAALGKEGIKAWLLTPLGVDAAPGSS